MKRVGFFLAPEPHTTGRVGVLLVLLLAATGCSSTASFHFRCDDVVNDGILLTIDVVRASEQEAQQIRERAIGEKVENWFYSTLRESLRPKIQTLTVERRCDKTIDVKIGSTDETLVVIADYRFEAGTVTSQLQTFPAKEVKGKTLSVGVKDRYLIVEKGD